MPSKKTKAEKPEKTDRAMVDEAKAERLKKSAPKERVMPSGPRTCFAANCQRPITHIVTPLGTTEHPPVYACDRHKGVVGSVLQCSVVATRIK